MSWGARVGLGAAIVRIDHKILVNGPDLTSQIEQSRVFYASGRKGLSFEDTFGEPLGGARKARR